MERGRAEVGKLRDKPRTVANPTRKSKIPQLGSSSPHAKTCAKWVWIEGGSTLQCCHATRRNWDWSDQC